MTTFAEVVAMRKAQAGSEIWRLRDLPCDLRDAQRRTCRTERCRNAQRHSKGCQALGKTADFDMTEEIFDEARLIDFRGTAAQYVAVLLRGLGISFVIRRLLMSEPCNKGTKPLAN